MLNLDKGINLFFGDTSSIYDVFGGLFKFLSMDNNFLFLSFDNDISSYIESISTYRQVNRDNFDKILNDNLFKIDIPVVFIDRNIHNIMGLIDSLVKTNLSCVVIIHTKANLINDILRLNADNRFLSNIYYLIKNPEYDSALSITHRPGGSIALPKIGNIFKMEKYMIKNCYNDDTFTVSQYKKSYIRDRKIDGFLDNSLEN